MALTVDLVKKLILQYIGGKPLLGNQKQVFIDQGKHLVAVQIPSLGGLGSLTGTLGNLVNQATSALSAVQGLVQNPMAALSSTIGNLAGGVLSQVQGLGLPTAELNKVIGSVGSLQNAATSLLDHTNILSGVVQDAEQIGTSMLGAQDLMQVSNVSDIQSLAGSLFADGPVDLIRQSLDPSVPGGVTDIVSNLAQAANPSDITQITDGLVKQLDDHATQINSIIQSDLTAHANFLQRNDIINSVTNLLPDPENEAQNLLFNRIATSDLLDINTELSGIDFNAS